MVKLKEEAVLVKELACNEKPVEINLLPTIDKFGILSEISCDAEGNAVMVCVDGIVRIVNLSSLKIICYAKLETEGFVSAAYCNSKCSLFQIYILNINSIAVLTLLFYYSRFR